MTEEEFKKGPSVPRPRPLTDEEAEGVRLFVRQQEGMRTRELMREQEQAIDHGRARNQQENGQIQPPVQTLLALPSGWANGFKTSEFWTAIAGVLLAVAKGYGYNIPEDAFWGIVVYILGRSGMKSAAAFRSGVKQ
jgi:hypothetical protein